MIATLTIDQPDRVAIVFPDRNLTFADLEAASNRLAHGLRALGLKSGDRLGLFVSNCPEFEIGFYAASKIGAVSCPLNSSYREREVTYQLNDAGATILLTHTKLWPVVEAARSQLTHLRKIVLIGDQIRESIPNVTSYQDVVAEQSTDPPLDRIDPR